MSRSTELKRFLMSARARLTPPDVGLPGGQRRRAPGLRREEVAMLAGISTTWYTKFEQGCDVQPSSHVLENLTSALRLSDIERDYLFALAHNRPPPHASSVHEAVAPKTQHVLDSLTIPALVVNEFWIVIGWNAAVTQSFRDYSQYEYEDRNLFRILLLSDIYKQDEDHFNEMARNAIARFKWDYSRTTIPEYFEDIILEMQEKSAAFREHWEKPNLSAHFNGIASVLQPGTPERRYQLTSFQIEEYRAQRLLLFTPLIVDQPAE